MKIKQNQKMKIISNNKYFKIQKVLQKMYLHLMMIYLVGDRKLGKIKK